jgi:hypothetical protein
MNSIVGWARTFSLLALFHVGIAVGACNHGLATAQASADAGLEGDSPVDDFGHDAGDFGDLLGKPDKKKHGFNVSKNAPSKQGSLFTANTTTKVQLQAEFLAAEMLTVQFDVIPPTAAAPVFGIFDAVADVSFTVQGGGTVRRTISIGSGTTISGPGQNCTVTMRDQSQPFFGPGAEYTVMAQVSPGSHATSAVPVTLRGFPTVVSVLAGGAVFLDIPPDAGVTSAEVTVSVLAAAALPVTALVDQVNLAGQILKQYDPNINAGFVAIAPNATRVVVNNLSGAFTYRVQITWGIDG